MVDDYVRAIEQARAQPDPTPDLPAHMRSSGDGLLAQLAEPFGVDARLETLFAVRRNSGGASEATRRGEESEGAQRPSHANGASRRSGERVTV